MDFHKQIKDTIINNKSKIQLYQWAFSSGISSLVYSEYLRRIQQKITPKRIIFVATIKSVEEFLKQEGQFIDWISENLIDRMINHPLFIKYNNAPELVLFNEENRDILKTILDLHMIPNIIKSIPNIIKIKFDLDNSENKTFLENKGIDLFSRLPITDRQFDFIVEEIILQLLLLLPTMKKNITIPNDNKNIIMDQKSILTIGNEKAICGIHFNKAVIENEDVIDLLKFVTSTTFSELTDDKYQYLIDSNPFNTVGIIDLEGIEIE